MIRPTWAVPQPWSKITRAINWRSRRESNFDKARRRGGGGADIWRSVCVCAWKGGGLEFIRRDIIRRERRDRDPLLHSTVHEQTLNYLRVHKEHKLLEKKSKKLNLNFLQNRIEDILSKTGDIFLEIVYLYYLLPPTS